MQHPKLEHGVDQMCMIRPMVNLRNSLTVVMLQIYYES